MLAPPLFLSRIPSLPPAAPVLDGALRWGGGCPLAVLWRMLSLCTGSRVSGLGSLQQFGLWAQRGFPYDSEDATNQKGGAATSMDRQETAREA